MATNLNQQLETPPVPDLPNPQDRYERLTVAQTNERLRTFFLRVRNAFQALLGPQGGKYLNSPYGAFQDSTSQTAANTTTAYAITFDTTQFSNGVTLSNSSRFNVSQDGVYNYEFSIQFKNTHNDTEEVDVWFRKNGTNIAKSNSRFGIQQRKSAGDPAHMIAAINFYVDMLSGDYIELMWRPSNTSVSIEAYGTSTSPTRPAVPSVIATLTYVSNLSA
jgi:hypothetical protein